MEGEDRTAGGGSIIGVRVEDRIAGGGEKDQNAGGGEEDLIAKLRSAFHVGLTFYVQVHISLVDQALKYFC